MDVIRLLSMFERKEELAPELWTMMPKEILENTIVSKLPFSSLVKFRAVCKHWCSVVIPEAAHQGQAASNRAPLLYVGIHEHQGQNQFDEIERDTENHPVGTVWWFRVCCMKSYWKNWKNVHQDFLPPSFPIPHFGDREHEVLLLMASEGGLLFFALSIRLTGLERDHNWLLEDCVVCNPLTGKFKRLKLPRRLLPIGESRRDTYEFVLVGAVVDATTGTYDLVVAGKDTADHRYKTFVYNSSTCEWANGPSIFPTLLQFGQDPTGLHLQFDSRRGTSCNRNLYWNSTYSNKANRSGENFVLKFDVPNMKWSSLRLDLDRHCDKILYPFQIASYENNILMWHVHEHPTFSNHAGFRGRANGVEDNSGYPLCKVGPSRSHGELDPLLKVMPQDMIDGMEGFVEACEENFHDSNQELCDYFAFSQGDFFYHLMTVSFPAHDNSVDGFMRFVVHNTEENLYTELPHVKQELFPHGHSICLSNFWSFAPSLISIP